VARDAPRRDQHGVKARVAAFEFWMGGEPGGSGRGDAALLSRQQRFCCAVQRVARLHLDKHQKITRPRHDVEFADRAAEAARGSPSPPGRRRRGSLPTGPT
jgi:hypothetical protein